VVWAATYTVSADQRELVVGFSDHAAPGTVTGELVYRKLDTGPSGTHPLTGAWQAYKLRQVSKSGASSYRPTVIA
jgi:hypothetical protein